MAKKFDLKLELAGLLTAALAYRSDTGVYASAIARELGLTIEDEESTVLARLREALAAQAPETGKPARTFRRSDVPGCTCGHAAADHHPDSVSGKRTYCSACDAGACRQYTAEPGADEACPAYRPGENGSRWPCALGMAHNTDEDSGQTVHRDQLGTEFRVARCQVPAAHGMTRCWCAIAEHHKPLATEPEPGTARTYLLGCGCQVTPAYGAVVGAPYACALHGDTTVTMAIPLGAPAAAAAEPKATS